jgi:Protein of unknown function (DUF2905)
MLKWLITTFIALAVLTTLQPWLRKLGLGRLPGDLSLRMRGRDVYIPFTTTILIAGLMGLLGYLI